MYNKYFLVVLIIFVIGCSESLTYNSVKDSDTCNQKKGHWYKEKCWQEFDDQGIAEADIDQVVAEQMKIIEKSKVIFDNEVYSLITVMPIEEDEEMVIMVIFRLENKDKTLLFAVKESELKDGVNFKEIPALLFNGNGEADELDEKTPKTGSLKIKIINIDNLEIEVAGVIMEEGKAKKISFTMSEAVAGAGTSVLEVKAGVAYLSGDLGTITYAQVKNLIKDHPQVKTIVLGNISGSVNDSVNMHTGRLVHEHGFTTKVLAGSDIASGGVDFFTAGVERIVEKGAKIGVHSWCCVGDLTAIGIPKDHPAHKYQLEYFTRALGPKYGPDFYFYTLEAAPFDGIHYMSDDEIKQWKLATQFIE